MNDNQEIIRLRADIDKTDAKICELIKKRFKTAKQIGQAKKNAGLAVCDTSRESAVYELIAAHFDDDNQKEAIKNIYKTIIEESKKLQNSKG